MPPDIEGQAPLGRTPDTIPTAAIETGAATANVSAATLARNATADSYAEVVLSDILHDAEVIG